MLWFVSDHSGRAMRSCRIVIYQHCKARGWSDQKRAFSASLSTFESVGLTRRALSRTMQEFTKPGVTLNVHHTRMPRLAMERPRRQTNTYLRGSPDCCVFGTMM